jgi:hypothetical protein
MQQQAHPVALPSQPAAPAPAAMQPLTATELRAVVGGPVIKNGGVGIETTSDSNG